MEMVKTQNFIEMSLDEMQETEGGAWWAVVGWICIGAGFGCELAGGIVGLCGGNSKVAGGLALAGTVLGFAGSILTGIPTK